MANQFINAMEAARKKLRVPRREFTEDELEAVMMVMGNVMTLREYSAAIGKKHPGNAQARAMSVLKWGLRQRLIKIKWLV